MPVLTGIDVLGIQDYVFASNRLRDVLAASYLVEKVTSEEFLKDLPKQSGAEAGSVLLAGGGNAVLEFPSLDEARGWTALYTRWLYDCAPGLEVAVAHRGYTTGGLARALAALQIALARAKLQRRPHAPLLGLGVSASCSVTGLPAVKARGGELLSRRIEALRDDEPAKELQNRWARLLPSSSEPRLAFPLRMDHLGRSRGETSLVGVVHVDGNELGKAIGGWQERCIDEEYDDQRVREEYREWSHALTRLGERVLKKLVQRVRRCVKKDEDRGYQLQGSPQELSFDLHREGDNIHLPLRPILLGGDDLTFVCDGRIALDLAAQALEVFARGRIPHLGQHGGELEPSACAGVALVKSHAPFHRSYQLAADLCTSAKRRRRQKCLEPDQGWLDWHLGLPRPHESVESLRRRVYHHQGNELTMRPYPLDSKTEDRLSWKWLEKDLLGGPQGKKKDDHSFRECAWWRTSRRRLERLVELAAQGGEAVKRQMEVWRTIDSDLKFAEPLDLGGFTGTRTPLWDAVELLDLHLSLEPCASDQAPGSGKDE